MHSLISKITEMCSLIENALLNLLNVPPNYLGKHSLPNCLYVCSDVGGVTSMRNSTRKNVLLQQNPGENSVDV